jgi:hypothetical protein
MAEPAVSKPSEPTGKRIEVPIRKAAGPGDDKLHTWPHLVRAEFLCTLFVTILFVVWSLLVDAPLEEPANPTRTPNPSKAPWYFLGLQEMLVFFDPWHAGVVLPSLIIVGLMLIPFLDINPNGNGYYTFAERKYELITFFFGFHVLWVSLIIIGTFVRGPGWNWFWPWEAWDPHKVEALTNVNLPYMLGLRDYFWSAVFGAVVVLAYFVFGTAGLWWWIHRLPPNRPFSAFPGGGPQILEEWGAPRFALTAFLFLNMLAVVIKMLLRHMLNVKYILVTPWLNI